ncbi:hypothetical protein A4X13_0g4425 [Tilletia indica]|uniref:Ataxin-10 homolog n=1 Tax=Tilletia indica TaxID=43049 RepID=A0A177T8N8_9BASI|nr:hypothetical protein A4X13_0g4425 [Tilletia indica]
MDSIQDLVNLLRQGGADLPSAQIKQLTREFAPQDSELRSQLASSASQDGSDLASHLATELFRLAARSIPQNAESSSKKVDALPQDIEISTYALRLARNVVAGCQDLQNIFWDKIKILDSVLSFTTAFAQVHDEIYRPLIRAAGQLLSNLLMANESTQTSFWARYIETGSSELGDAQLILRLLASSDHGTLVATILILLTCCRGSQERSRQLATSPACRPSLEMLLSILEQSFRDFAEAEHDSSGSPIDELDELSSLTYSLFSHLFARQLFGPMLINIAPAATVPDSEEADVPHNPVTGSQRTLLGLFDAYIYAGADEYGEVSHRQNPQENPDVEALLSTFVRLGIHLRSAMTQLPRPPIPGSSASGDIGPPLPGFDARTLIGVPQAIVLVVQCMSEWMVLSSKRVDEAKGEGSDAEKVDPFVLAGRRLLERKRGLAKENLAKVVVGSGDPLANHSFSPQDPVGVAISLLREAAAVFPAESPFKSSNATSNSTSSTTRPTDAPQDHVLSHTGASSLSTASPAATQLENAGGPGKMAFTYLKRELVRLVGIVSFVEARGGSESDKEGVRDVQDYVRELGGLFVVLGMTQVDELNPYIREHAVFALRNLLAGNQTSQDLIAQLRKVEEPQS